MNDKKIKKCRHKTQLMTDFLAGELSDKDQKTFEKRLESCASCRAKFAELEATWKLTTEMLKTSEVGGRKTEVGAQMSVVSWEKKEKNISRRQGYGGQVEHSTSNVQHRMEEEDRKEKQSPNHQISKSPNTAKKQDEKKKGFSFAYGELAASVILVFVALVIFGLTTNKSRQILAGAASSFGSKDAEKSYSENNAINILKKMDEAGLDLDGVDEAPKGKGPSNSYSVQKSGSRSRYSSKRKYKRSKPRTAPASVASPEISADPGSLSRSTSSGRKISVKHYAKKKPKSTPRLAPKPEAKRRQKFYKSRQASKSLKLNNVQLAETEDELGQETQKVAKLEEEVKKLHKRTADLMGGPVEPVDPARKSNGFGFGSTIVNAPAKPTPGLPKRKAEKELRGRPVFRIGVAQREKVRKQAAADDGDDDFLADEDEEKAMNFADAEGEDGVEEVVEEIGKDEKDRDAISFKWAKDTDKKAKEIPTLGDMPVLGNALNLDNTEKQDKETIILGKQAETLNKRTQYTRAREKYEQILLKDSYNEKALKGIKKITPKMYEAGKQRYESAQTTSHAEVEWNYVSPLIARSLGPTGEVQPAPGSVSKTKKALDKVTVPNMEWEDASITGVVAQLQKYADKAGIKLKTKLSQEAREAMARVEKEAKIKKDDELVEDAVGGEGEKTITIMFDDLTLGESIRNICIAADMNYRVENGVVIIASKTVPLDDVETSVVPMDSETFKRIGGTQKALNDYFQQQGIAKLEGTKFTYDSSTQKLIITNTEENIKRALQVIKNSRFESKTLKANLKLWDMKTAKGVADFLAKHKINVGAGSYEIEGGSVKFKLPAAEMEKVEKLFFELNETEDKMKAVEQGLPFLRTKQKPFSTFSIDVDTASYTRVAKDIKQGKRPSSDAVRPEEFINYFDYHYRSPMDAIFGVNLEAAPSNFRPMNTTLRIGVQGKRLGSEVKRPSALTILIDTSGSMANKNRLELVKQSIPMLLGQLRAKDQVSVISCGSSIKQIVSRRSASKKSYIENAVNNIEPLGVTNLEKGIIFAYQMAARNYVAGGYNRVLIFTDGISNVSKASADEILKQIETARQKGITNTVLSVGGDGDDALLEGIADKGDGSYVFLENAESAKDLFENQFSARFREIARDVKIQVEFNPKWVREYRQVGYDNRQLAKSDFRNDKVDAGEVGAGQSVTALYELKINRIMPLARKAQTSIYPPPDMTIATVRIRYKRADNLEIEEHEFPYRLQDIMPSYNSTSPSFQLASAVAEFAENLKYPETKGIANYNTIRRALRPLLSTTYANDKKVRELDNLVRLAK